MSDDKEVTTPDDPKVSMMYWHERAMAAEAALASERAKQAEPVAVGHDGKPWPHTIDAKAWADEFCKRNTATDNGTMIGWFANAIEFARAYDDAPPAMQEEPVAWMVGNDPMTAATYNAGDKEKAFDAAKRWNWPITGLSVIAGAPDFDINYQQTKPVGEWRMKNGEPMHVLWRARYKPQLGDKLYAAPPAAPTFKLAGKADFHMSAEFDLPIGTDLYYAAPPAVQAEPDAEIAVIRDAARYRRLQILGVAPGGSRYLDNGTVLRFTNLDKYVDNDIAAHPSRGESTIEQALRGVCE